MRRVRCRILALWVGLVVCALADVSAAQGFEFGGPFTQFDELPEGDVEEAEIHAFHAVADPPRRSPWVRKFSFEFGSLLAVEGGMVGAYAQPGVSFKRRSSVGLSVRANGVALNQDERTGGLDIYFAAAAPDLKARRRVLSVGAVALASFGQARVLGGLADARYRLGSANQVHDLTFRVLAGPVASVTAGDVGYTASAQLTYGLNNMSIKRRLALGMKLVGKNSTFKSPRWSGSIEPAFALGERWRIGGSLGTSLDRLSFVAGGLAAVAF